MEELLKQILGKLESLEQGQQLLVQAQNNLEQGQLSLIQGQKDLEQGQKSLEQGQAEMRSEIDLLQTGQKELSNRLDSRIDKLEIRMENEIIEKIRGLYDAREVSMDYFTNIKDALARLENKQESVFNVLVNLDIKQREYDRELRLLRIEKQ